jgi:hypothetical protein
MSLKVEPFLQQIAAIVDKPVWLTLPINGKYLINYGVPPMGTFLAQGAVEVARFCLKPMPGCSGACVSYGVKVNETFRHKGIGGILNEMQQHMAYEQDASVLTCTVTLQNEYQQRILRAKGWSEIQRFKNRKTDNIVCVWSIRLRE